MGIYEELRDRYRPDVVDYLLVGESPPVPRHGKLRFFYSPVLTRPDSLYRAVATAFLDIEEAELARKVEMLERLREKRVWLVDVVDDPINDKSPSERRALLEAAIGGFVERCKGIAPRRGILVCQKSVRALVRPHLQAADLQIFPRALNFPRADQPAWRQQFIEGMRAFRDGNW